METKVLKASKNSIKEAAKRLRAGEVVGIPTETVYGLGANALDVNAVRKIFKAKGRPMDNPLIIHIADKKDIKKYTKNAPASLDKIMDVFWPGPLTIVLEKTDLVPKEITGGLDTVAVRMPANDVALDIIREARLPIAAPSANVSGKPSPTKAVHVKSDMDGKIGLIIDGGDCEVGVESTVLDLSADKAAILRPGKITKEMLSPYVEIKSVVENVENSATPKAPGMKYRHYAPKAKIVVYQGRKKEIVDEINKDIKANTFKGIKLGVIIESEYKDNIDCENVYDIGSELDEDEVAKNLFSTLRKLDEDGVELAFIPVFESRHIGKATMNRLLKAASYNVKKVKEKI